MLIKELNMKRYVIILILLTLTGTCLAMSNRAIFVKVYHYWNSHNHTVQQIIDANDLDVISKVGLDPNEIIEWNRWKRGIKGLAKHKVQERKRLVRETTISIPGLTQIVRALKADGRTTAEARAELLKTAKEQLQ
jgi:hypothetical protein